MVIFEKKTKRNGEKVTVLKINKDAVPVVVLTLIAILALLLTVFGVSAGDIVRILGSINL